MVNLCNGWDEILQEEFNSEYYLTLRQFLKQEYSQHTVYPDMFDIFNAFKLTPYNEVKIVILGQDPYHGAGQAHGLAFSVKEGIEIPPSLLNIFKEIRDDLGCSVAKNGCLERWSKQGVLLLNTTLTVRAGMPNSHAGKGWQIFTDRVVEKLNRRHEPIIFMLWGKNAKSKIPLITNNWHYILTAPHPSPLSASSGFFGCRHFSKANEILRELGKAEIEWGV